MATSASTIEYLTDQFAEISNLRFRKMFGEYALFMGNKVVALVADDTLFVKPTDAGKRFAEGNFREAPAYPKAKPGLAISDDFIEDRERVAELLRITEAELPEPKRKKK